MFATRATPYNIVDWTPFHRDPLKELADECRRQGIKLFFYYSQLDWHSSRLLAARLDGAQCGPARERDWNRYLDFLDAQLTSCSTNYGALGGIWFDGNVGQAPTHCRLAAGQTYALIHRLQPQAFDRAEPSSSATAWRRCADVRAGFAGREHRRFQYEDHRKACRSRRRSR